MKRYFLSALIFIILFTFGFSEIFAKDKTPAQFITEKFSAYNIICLDEGPHSTIQTHRLIRELFNDKVFNSTVDYIIIEFANQKHQKTLDRFIIGKKVTLKDLRLLWRSTTQAHSTNFEKSVYLKLLKTIRAANKKLPKNNKIRVIAGDPPINWNNINSQNDYFPAITQRDVLPSELAIKYGIESSKKVLLIYGGEHLKMQSSGKDSTYWTIPYYINKKYPGSVYTIGALISGNYPDLKFNVPVNSIIELSSDPAGDLIVKNGGNNSNKNKLKEDFDAVYYAGPSESWQLDDEPKSLDADYWDELNRRARIIWGEGIDENLKLKK